MMTSLDNLQKCQILVLHLVLTMSS